jgi:hypothetical protein
MTISMKSLHESSDHIKILTQRELERDRAREFLNEGSEDLGNMTRKKAGRILMNDLTRSEREERREAAGVKRRPRVFREDTTPEIKPEKIDNRTLLEALKPEAITQFLSEL